MSHQLVCERCEVSVVKKVVEARMSLTISVPAAVFAVFEFSAIGSTPCQLLVSSLQRSLAPPQTDEVSLPLDQFVSLLKLTSVAEMARVVAAAVSAFQSSSFHSSEHEFCQRMSVRIALHFVSFASEGVPSSSLIDWKTKRQRNGVSRGEMDRADLFISSKR
jgi:hypothetical protein